MPLAAPTRMPTGSLQASCQKAKVCKFYEQGGCARGSACKFAHGTDSLRPLPDLLRTKVCPKAAADNVCADPSCPFAHSWEERRRVRLYQALSGPSAPVPASTSSARRPAPLRPPLHSGSQASSDSTDESIVDTISTAASTMEAPPGSPTLIKQNDGGNKFRKTKLCVYFESGSCEKKSCRFAHGEAELMVPLDLTRTKLCPQMASGRPCRDGCRFAHSTTELVGKPATQHPPVEQDAAAPELLAEISGEAGLAATLGNKEEAYCLMVKNSFLHVGDRSRAPARMRFRTEG